MDKEQYRRSSQEALRALDTARAAAHVAAEAEADTARREGAGGAELFERQRDAFDTIADPAWREYERVMREIGPYDTIRARES